MVRSKTSSLASFRRKQAALRKKQWARTILKARKFTGIQTLRQGLAFSEDVINMRRRWQLEAKQRTAIRLRASDNEK
jgi:hypothetical protein